MSTNINISVGDNKLLAQASLQQNASRQAQLEKEANKRLQTEAEINRVNALAAQGKDANGNSLTGTRIQVPQLERRPAANRVDGCEKFNFAPYIANDNWQVRKNTGKRYDLDIVIVSGYPPEFRSGGGPHVNSDAIRYPNLSPLDSAPWSSLKTQNADRVSPPKKNGFTFEFYADFGPDGIIETVNVNHNATIQCFLSDPTVSNGIYEPFYVVSPFIHLGAQVNVLKLSNSNSDLESSLVMYIRYNPSATDGSPTSTGGFIYPLAESVGVSVTDNLGWQHFAGEIYKDGKLRMYHNGIMVSETQDTPLSDTFFDSLQQFVPAQVTFPDTRISGRPYLDVHGVRYSNCLLYNGQNFVPPVYR